MSWDEYVKGRVEELALSRDVAGFEAVLGDIERNLTAWKADGERREWFWNEVRAKYEKAPKLLLKDTTAAAKLYALHKLAAEMLASAQQQSIAASAASK